MRLSTITALVLALVVTPTSLLYSAPCQEISVIPIGTDELQRGAQEATFHLPAGPTGPLLQPVVFIAVQPRLTPTTAPQAGMENPEEQGRQVPCTLKFTAAGRELPPWELQATPTAFVVNVDLIKANPQFAQGQMALTVNADTTAETIQVTLLGMPDLLLLDPPASGPLAGVAASATDAEAKAYLQGLVLEISGDKAAAKDAYQKLQAAKNERVARFARRGLRMLAYQMRRYPLSGNFTEHYRWALFLREGGLYSAAFAEFEECRVIMPARSYAQYAAGEMFDRLGNSAYRVLDYMDRTVETSGIADPNEWSVLVPILLKRGEVTLKYQQVQDIENNWLIVERMIWAATGGHLRLVTSFYEIAGEQQQAYAQLECGYYAPTDDIVEARGWYDGVVSVVPRLPAEAGKPGRTFGGDTGPNGANLSCMFSDATWQDLAAACYEQLSWTAARSGMGRGVPLGEQGVGCGPPLSPHIGYADRAALHYHFTPAMSRRLKQADVPGAGGWVQLWELVGPSPVRDTAVGQGEAKHHVLDPIAPGGSAIAYVSNGSFVDLARVFPNAGPAVVQATTWVYSPQQQEVRLWLGANDGLAVWVNGRSALDGYFPAGKFEDRNLVDTVASWAELKEGWNEIRLVVESLPAPHGQGWGFSLRFCTWDNKPIPGLAVVNGRPAEGPVPSYQPPAAGPYYLWAQVKHDWRQLLPELKAADLETLTGTKGLQVAGSVDKLSGYFALNAPGQPDAATYRNLTKPWQIGTDRDVVVNNVLDWEREACAAYRYQKGGKDRDLLFVKPEVFEAYTIDLGESPTAATLFGGSSPSERLLGYVVIPAAGSATAVPGWTLLVIDTLLADTGNARPAAWPQDEEDLLNPVSSQYIPNWKLLPVGPVEP